LAQKKQSYGQLATWIAPQYIKTCFIQSLEKTSC